jgi:transcriptional regulator with XRE-family HTH domain
VVTTPEQDIGKRVRSLRLQRGLNLQELASLTNLSKSLLSKIENGKVSSPVSTLFVIAKALNTKITYFFSDRDENPPIILVRKNERKQFHRVGARFGYTYEALGYKRKEKLMEPFILYVDKDSPKNISFSHPGEELLFMLDGTSEFTYGDQKLIVRKGDCVYFDANVPHIGKAVGNKPVIAFMVICSGENSRSPLGELVLKTLFSQAPQKDPSTRLSKPGTRPEGAGVSAALGAKKIRGTRRRQKYVEVPKNESKQSK